MPILVVALVLAVLLLFTHTAAVTVPVVAVAGGLFLWGVYRKQ